MVTKMVGNLQMGIAVGKFYITYDFATTIPCSESL